MCIVVLTATVSTILFSNQVSKKSSMQKNLMELVWLVLGVVASFLLHGAEANNCTEYPFPSCPRLGDPTKYSVCCIRHHRYTCCTVKFVEGWIIALIVIGCIGIVCAILGSICYCCGCCKKKRREYTVIRDELPPQQPQVVLVTAARPVHGQYYYNTMAKPPSNISVPPPYLAQKPTTSGPATQSGGSEPRGQEEVVSHV